MTAIVGPNGCGKSNIVDAMLWCMGEQSPKHLRGKEMADVIFAGSESRPPSGMAEVSLFFEVDDRPVSMEPDTPPATDGGEPIPELLEAALTHLKKLTEVQVTRCLFRSGESE